MSEIVCVHSWRKITGGGPVAGIPGSEDIPFYVFHECGVCGRMIRDGEPRIVIGRIE